MLLETKVTQLCGLYLPARVITQCWQPVTVQSPRAFAEASRPPPKLPRKTPRRSWPKGSRCKTSFCKPTSMRTDRR